MIEVINLVKRFGDSDIIRNLNLKVEKGQVVSVVGPSGCGKTTLLRCITGLDSDFEGQVSLDGKNGSEYLESNRIAIVLQKYSNFPWLNVRENIATAFIRNSLKSREEQNLIIDNLLNDLNLKTSGEKFINELSGGMQQRVAVARAIAQDTSIMALDEPFGALDVTNRNNLQLIFKDLNEKFIKTVLFVTHDIEEAIFVSDKVVVLTGAPTRVFEIFDSFYKPQMDLEVKYDDEFIKLKRNIEVILKKV